MGYKWEISHDSCRVGDRVPLGAVPVGTSVRVVMRVDSLARGDIKHAYALVYEYGLWHEVSLRPCDEGFAGFIDLSGQPHVVFYVFRMVFANGSAAYYVPYVDGRSTAGELAWPGIDGEWTEGGWSFYDRRLGDRPQGDFGLPVQLPGFQITAFDPAFKTPEWMAGAIMYQIFPDRFARGSGGVRSAGLAYHKKMKRPVDLHEDWNEPVLWTGNPDYDPIDFYGGTLDGIREKLPYLASLGVEVIYLNPVFEARSNHRYDTADYERIDALLGDEREFRRLTREASRLGISIVLDAVLSHTGNDSRYFNALENYDEPGAVQGSVSPFFSWYEFTYQGGRATGYKSWWGFPSLPEVDERQPSWQRYMFGDGPGEGDVKPFGVLPKWLLAGARGYRLDVADEVPDDVLSKIRACVKETSPEAVIIGEVWEDATTKMSYGTPRNYALGPSLDSVMNYPLRAVLIGFALGTLDAAQVATFLKLQKSNYPAPMYQCLMNLLSSHDMERVRSVLALGGSVKQLSREGQVAAVAGISARRDKEAARLQRLIAGLMYALPGTPCIYYGDERGLHGGGDPFCRATFPWDDGAGSSRDDAGVDLTEHYRKLGKMRKGSQPLRTGDCHVFAPHEDVLCIVRTVPGAGSSVAVANRSRVAHHVAIDTKRDVNGEVVLETQAVEDGIVCLDAPPRATTFYF